MESHIRVYIAENWNALKYLPCAAYKVLMAIVQRADNVGRCFPSVERIADDCGLHPQTVYKSLQTLEDTRYIGYLRKNECDPVTGRFMPNVYLVSPYLICIAEDYQVESIALWKSVYEGLPMPMPFESISYTNQQQEPATKNLHHLTNNRNQQQQPPFAEKSVNEDESEIVNKSTKKTSERRKKFTEEPTSDESREKQAAGSQRSLPNQGSAKIKENYVNPDPMPVPLPDGLQERLAEQVNELGIPMPMARGMILAHSYDLVEVALKQLEVASKKQDIGNPAGFFRFVLERRVLDARLPEVLSEKPISEGQKYITGEYADWIES